jgi:hypothetical protein
MKQIDDTGLHSQLKSKLDIKTIKANSWVFFKPMKFIATIIKNCIFFNFSLFSIDILINSQVYKFYSFRFIDYVYIRAFWLKKWKINDI